MSIEADIHNKACRFAAERFPSGTAGVAAVRVESGKILTSVAPDVKNECLSLCIEVGAYLEAHKLNEKVTHSLCLYRETEQDEYIILTPCGVCQERLTHWGGDVLAAVTNKENKLIFKTIRELQPYHWSAANGQQL